MLSAGIPPRPLYQCGEPASRDTRAREYRVASLGDGIAVSDERLTTPRGWNRKLADARYAAIAWPEEWGGRGAGIMEQVVFAEEMHRSGAPGTLNAIGLSNIAPAIIAFGTDEQKRALLPRMLRGDDIRCQGFSEPTPAPTSRR